MPPGRQPIQELETTSYGGMNTALQFSQIPYEQSPHMKNAYMPKIQAIGKRPGSIPLTGSPLGAAAEYLTVYFESTEEDMLLASGTSLYKFETDTLTEVTMTNALNRADIYSVAFTDGNSNAVLVIADGGNLKQYDGTEVKDVPAAADDPDPEPANDLTNINAKGPAYTWVYSGHVFVAYDRMDGVNYSKRFFFDYFPEIQYERWVRENDYITGPGIGFNNVCLIPMRRGWGLLTGSTLDDFNGNQFLNTINGCIAPRSIQRITYPTGTQTIAYLSDDGVYEIYDTGFQDFGSRNYSTRYLMKDKIDFDEIGLTEDEKKAAVGYYSSKYNMYLLAFERDGKGYVYGYDTRNGEWYPWEGLKVKGFYELDGVLHFIDDSGHLKVFDANLYSDWHDKDRVGGTPVHFQRYSAAQAMEFSGFQSYWDYYLIEAQQWSVKSSLDVKAIFSTTTVELEHALQNELFVWGVSKWGQAKWANIDYTDNVNQPNELIFHKKAKYVQVVWDNNRDEPVEIFKDKWKGRPSRR